MEQFNLLLFAAWGDRENALYLSGAVVAVIALIGALVGFGIGRMVKNQDLAGILGALNGALGAVFCIAILGGSGPVDWVIWIGIGTNCGGLSAYISSRAVS